MAILREFFDLCSLERNLREDHELKETVSLAGLQNPTFEQHPNFPLS